MNDKRSRSPANQMIVVIVSPTPPPTLPSGKRRDVNSELHQLAKTLNRHRQIQKKVSAYIIKKSTGKITRINT